MRFVETVPSKFFHQVEQLFCQSLVNSARHSAVHEDAALQRHLLSIFFPHRAAQQVRRSQRITADDLRDLHYLLLVHDHTVSRLERNLQFGMKIISLGTAMLTVDEILYHA